MLKPKTRFMIIPLCPNQLYLYTILDWLIEYVDQLYILIINFLTNTF